MSVIGDGVIEFAAYDEINIFAGVQSLVWLDVAVRANERNFQRRIGFFDLAQELNIAVKANRRSKQNEKFIVLADIYGLLPVDFVRRSVEQPASRDQSRRIAKPNRK